MPQRNAETVRQAVSLCEVNWSLHHKSASSYTQSEWNEGIQCMETVHFKVENTQVQKKNPQMIKLFHKTTL